MAYIIDTRDANNNLVTTEEQKTLREVEQVAKMLLGYSNVVRIDVFKTKKGQLLELHSMYGRNGNAGYKIRNGKVSHIRF